MCIRDSFEAAGSAVTYDSNSFAPDSASTATSIATGYKTYSGSINVDETATVESETCLLYTSTGCPGCW